MNQQFRGCRKLVHLDAIMCQEMSNTEDGTRCLREPMSSCTKDPKTSLGLIPRLSRKSTVACNQSFQTLGTNCGYADAAVPLDDVEWTDTKQPKHCEFVSARTYMNPTLNLSHTPLPVPQNNHMSPVKPTHGTTSRKPNTRHIATVTQKNSLEKYFKPVCTSMMNTDQPVPVSQSHTARCAEFVQDHHSCTPENSPRKSVLSSPLSKLPGCDNIYYSPPVSRSSTSCDSVTSSWGSSSASNASRSQSSHSAAAASALNDDDDDLDFEASFDYIWKTNPRKKRKSTKQKGSSKKQATRAAELSKLGIKSDNMASLCEDSTVAPVLQQHNTASLDMSAENFGLFGFSNNTLIALDSDTDFEEDAVDHFSLLPHEVLSNILCRLPFTDLCLNVNRVCLSWKYIIDSDDVSHFLIIFCFFICYAFFTRYFRYCYGLTKCIYALVKAMYLNPVNLAFGVISVPLGVMGGASGKICSSAAESPTVQLSPPTGILSSSVTNNNHGSSPF